MQPEKAENRNSNIKSILSNSSEAPSASINPTSHMTPTWFSFSRTEQPDYVFSDLELGVSLGAWCVEFGASAHSACSCVLPLRAHVATGNHRLRQRYNQCK